MAPDAAILKTSSKALPSEGTVKPYLSCFGKRMSRFGKGVRCSFLREALPSQSSRPGAAPLDPILLSYQPVRGSDYSGLIPSSSGTSNIREHWIHQNGNSAAVVLHGCGRTAFVAGSASGLSSFVAVVGSTWFSIELLSAGYWLIQHWVIQRLRCRTTTASVAGPL